jgi:hypothetical protein
VTITGRQPSYLGAVGRDPCYFCGSDVAYITRVIDNVSYTVCATCSHTDTYRLRKQIALKTISSPVCPQARSYENCS